MELSIGGFNTLKTGAIVNDTHDPLHDSILDRLVERFLFELQPSFLIINGDAIDFRAISRFAKDPRHALQLPEELSVTKARFTRYRALLPNAIILFNKGNHEARLMSYLWNRAPELAAIPELKLEHLLGLDINDIPCVDYKEGIMINDSFFVTHGELISKHAGWTAKAHSEKMGGNGMVGHSHRGGFFPHKDRFGYYGWWENFCMCDLHPEYDLNPNWMQGFSLLHIKQKRFHVEPIPVIEHEFIYGGREYKNEN